MLGFRAPDPTLLVQETVGLIMQHQKVFTDQLYQRIFDRAPATKELFHGDMVGGRYTSQRGRNNFV